MMRQTYRAGRFTVIVEDDETSILDIPEIDEAGERKIKRRRVAPLSFLAPKIDDVMSAAKHLLSDPRAGAARRALGLGKSTRKRTGDAPAPVKRGKRRKGR